MGCCCSKHYNSEESLKQLTKEQEKFLSSHKLNIHLSNSDELRASTFNLIEEEFEKMFNRKISSEELYKFYNVNC